MLTLRKLRLFSCNRMRLRCIDSLILNFYMLKESWLQINMGTDILCYCLCSFTFTLHCHIKKLFPIKLNLLLFFCYLAVTNV